MAGACRFATLLLIATCFYSALCFVEYGIGNRHFSQKQLPCRFERPAAKGVGSLQASLIPSLLAKSQRRKGKSDEEIVTLTSNKRSFQNILQKGFSPLFGMLILFNGGNIGQANAMNRRSEPNSIGLTSRIIKQKTMKRVRKVVESPAVPATTEAPRALKSEEPEFSSAVKVTGTALVVAAGSSLFLVTKKKKEKEEKKKLLEEKMKKMSPVKKKKSTPKAKATSKPVTPPAKQPEVPETSMPADSVKDLYSSSSVAPAKDKVEEQPLITPPAEQPLTPPPAPVEPEPKLKAEAPAPAPAPTPVEEPAPAPVEEKKPKFNLFKKKDTNNRPNSLADALLIEGPTEEFRTISAQILAKMAPDSAFPLIKGGETDSKEEAIEKLVASKIDAGLSDNQAAEEFACVVNAMIVQLVDEAVDTLKEGDEKSLEALDAVMDFMDDCSSVFGSLAENPNIKPVRYNGETGKGKLESLYARYAFDAMGSMAADNSEKLARLDRFQDVFNIPNGKAEKVAQQAMTKMMQKVMSGEIDASELGLGEGADIMEALKGLGGMGAKEDGFPGGMPGMPGMPDFGGDMGSFDPKEMDPKMVEQTISTLKEMVAGGVAPEEVAELRKMFKGMGMDLDQLVDMSEGLGAELGPEGRELFNLMKQILGKN